MNTTSQPPPYTPTPNSPEPITLLLLGPPSVGKSTFLTRLPHLSLPTLPPLLPSHSQLPPPPRPQTFNVSLFNRPYPIAIYPNTSPLFTDPYPSHPSLAVLCFAINDRSSLHLATKYWRRQLTSHYPGHEMPVLLLGLKRDLRHDRRAVADDGAEAEEFECVMPHEGLRAAGEIRADRYAECSALTGELLWEVVEDVTRMAAGTRTDKGGFSDGASGGCVVM